jgi:hypothetical protein
MGTVSKQRTGIVIEVKYYDKKFNNLFFDVENCEVEEGFLAIEHCVANRNEEGKIMQICTYTDLKNVKGYKVFASLDDYNGYYGIYPKWGVGKKYKIEVEYLDKDNKPVKWKVIEEIE